MDDKSSVKTRIYKGRCAVKYPGYFNIQTVDADYFNTNNHYGFTILDTIEMDTIEERSVSDAKWVMRNGEYTLDQVSYNKSFKLKKTMFVLGEKDHNYNGDN